MNLQNSCLPNDIIENKKGHSSTEKFDDILTNSVTKKKQDGEEKQNEQKRSGSQAFEEQKDEGSSTGGDFSVVTPYLVKHINDLTMIPKDNFHRFCYRHNPDVTSNKVQDGDKMKDIQKRLERLPTRDKEAITHVWSIFSAAPHQHRALILQGLLSQCCFPQLSLISQEVSSLIKIDFIAALPVEIALKILCYLDCSSLCNAAQVSRKWKSLADDDRVWHHMCEQHIDRKCPNCGWGLPLMHMQRMKEMESESIKQSMKAAATESNNQKDGEVEHEIKRIKYDQQLTEKVKKPLKRRPWKSVYCERYKLEKNWRKGIYTSTSFIGHTEGATCLQFNNKYLISGSDDTTIKVWRTSTGECLRTLTGHSEGIRALVFDHQKLITGGLDTTIRVWNYHSGECLSVYRGGHSKAVLSLDFLGKTIVSGSADLTVKVWHVDSRNCYTLRGHTDWVNSVKLHALSNTVFSASDDTTIRMWDLGSNVCLRVFGGLDNSGHIGQVQCIIPFIYKDELEIDKGEDNAVVSGANGNLDTNNAEANEQLPGDQGPGDQGFLDNPNYPTHLLTCSLDNTIKLWDVESGKCIRTQFGHIDGVWSISSDTFRIVSGGHDRLIKVWDLQNGKCLHTFGCDSTVNSVALGDSQFAAAFDNGMVRMYSFS